MPDYYADYDRPASRAAYENTISNTSILHTPNPVYTTTEADDARSTIIAFEEVYCHETTACGGTLLESIVLGVEPCNVR